MEMMFLLHVSVVTMADWFAPVLHIEKRQHSGNKNKYLTDAACTC